MSGAQNTLDIREPQAPAIFDCTILICPRRSAAASLFESDALSRHLPHAAACFDWIILISPFLSFCSASLPSAAFACHVSNAPDIAADDEGPGAQNQAVAAADDEGARHDGNNALSFAVSDSRLVSGYQAAIVAAAEDEGPGACRARSNVP